MPNKRSFLKIISYFLLSSVSLKSYSNTAHPNIVLIIADDMGWKDVGYHGSEIQTPNLDQLAAEGIRLDRFYVQPYCTATRASLMTGQTAVRIGIKGPFLSASNAHLPLDLKILPELLQVAGYQTALTGKWHLGHAKKEALPMARGFDQAYGYLTGGLGYWDHVSGGRYDWHRNQSTSREEGYATHLIGQEAVRVIKERDKTKPLFLYAAFSAPHLPNEAPEETIQKYAHIDNEHRRIHAAMVDELDSEIGNIINALEQEGMAQNTIVWFLSDNGGSNEKYGRGNLGKVANLIEKYIGTPAPTRLLETIRSVALDGGSDNGPYKGGKGHVHEGGVLVPSVLSWPAKLPGRPIAERITVQDMMPTLLSLAGTQAKYDQLVDGADVSELLRGNKQIKPVDFLIESKSHEAYYMDHWKLYRNSDNRVHLFNLQQDPYEKKNIANKYPDVVTTIMDKLNAFPRGKKLNVSNIWLFIDPESHGGKETREPWADLIH